MYVKYDAPALASWENSLVYRNEEIPFTLDPDERRWALSYNASWQLKENISSHAGLLYQPFRLDTPYQDEDLRPKRTKERDALGVTWRLETRPASLIDTAGLGYTYLGPVAGNKHQVDADAGRLFRGAWNVSAAYMYRTPIVGPEPLVYEGTASNPGALLANPRGPDDPFWVQWDNREAHIASLTLVYDPTPDTWTFRYQKNVLEEWNMSPEEDAPWVAALQYRLTHYPTNTDRLYYFDEERQVIYDPIFRQGALATSYPFSSATGWVRWNRDRWKLTADLSGGQALAANAIAYTSATNFYKPSTTFVHGGVSVQNGPVKVFGRYGQDVWGPEDYHLQQGLAYHKVYQAGLSCTFLNDFLAGFRYAGTRMTNEFIGSDAGAFNEYRFFLTYHFGTTLSLGKPYELRGRKAEAPAPMTSVAPQPAPPVPKPVEPDSKAFSTVSTPEGLKLTLTSQVLFETNQYRLKATAQQALDQVIKLLQAYPDSDLRVSGHTDSVGSVAFNQKLSERRAQSVTDYLARGGLGRARIAVVGRGEGRPAGDNATEEGRALNRRVEIDILK